MTFKKTAIKLQPIRSSVVVNIISFFRRKVNKISVAAIFFMSFCQQLCAFTKKRQQLWYIWRLFFYLVSIVRQESAPASTQYLTFFQFVSFTFFLTVLNSDEILPLFQTNQIIFSVFFLKSSHYTISHRNLMDISSFCNFILKSSKMGAVQKTLLLFRKIALHSDILITER